MNRQAFVLRISPSEVDKVQEALDSNQIIIGWANASGLLDRTLSWEKFRKIIQQQPYYSEEKNLRRIGNATGQMWRFIRDMKKGDLVVVPRPYEFYVAEVDGDATYSPELVGDDTAYRRPVKWLNNKKPIPRNLARTAMISRMKAYGTCTNATDLIEEIEECLTIAESGDKHSFQGDLQTHLIKHTLEILHSGRIENFGFERLVESVLIGLGAKNSIIIPRRKDKGADIIADFNVAGPFTLKVAVQVKHWQPEPPVSETEIGQLINGIESDSSINLGMFVTTGKFSKEATEAAEKYSSDKGIKIELVDGEQFAKLILEQGLGVTRFKNN